MGKGRPKFVGKGSGDLSGAVGELLVHNGGTVKTETVTPPTTTPEPAPQEPAAVASAIETQVAVSETEQKVLADWRARNLLRETEQGWQITNEAYEEAVTEFQSKRKTDKLSVIVHLLQRTEVLSESLRATERQTGDFVSLWQGTKKRTRHKQPAIPHVGFLVSGADRGTYSGAYSLEWFDEKGEASGQLQDATKLSAEGFISRQQPARDTDEAPPLAAQSQKKAKKLRAPGEKWEPRPEKLPEKKEINESLRERIIKEILEGLMWKLDKGMMVTANSLQNLLKNSEARQKIADEFESKFQQLNNIKQLSTDEHERLEALRTMRIGSVWADVFAKDLQKFLENKDKLIRHAEAVIGEEKSNLAREKDGNADRLERWQELYYSPDLRVARVGYETEEYVKQFLSADDQADLATLTGEERREKVRELFKKHASFAVPAKLEFYPAEQTEVSAKRARARANLLSPDNQRQSYEELGVALKERGSLDGESALALYRIAGFTDNEAVQVAPGLRMNGYVNINTGNKDGAVMERYQPRLREQLLARLSSTDAVKLNELETRVRRQHKIPVVNLFDDHHHDASGKDTAATLVTYQRLKDLGFGIDQALADKFELAPEQCKTIIPRAFDLITREDNKSYTQRENWQTESHLTISGLAHAMNFEQVMAWAKLQPPKAPHELLTADEIKALGLEKISAKQQEIVKGAKKQIEYLRNNGSIIETPGYGTVAITTGYIPGGYDAVRSLVLDEGEKPGAFLLYNYSPRDRHGSVLFSTIGREIDPKISDSFHGTLVRGTQFLWRSMFPTDEKSQVRDEWRTSTGWTTYEARNDGPPLAQFFKKVLGVANIDDQALIHGQLRKLLGRERSRPQPSSATPESPLKAAETLEAPSNLDQLLEAINEEKTELDKMQAEYHRLQAELAVLRAEYDKITARGDELRKELAEEQNQPTVESAAKDQAVVEPAPDFESDKNKITAVFDQLMEDYRARKNVSAADFWSFHLEPVLREWKKTPEGVEHGRNLIKYTLPSEDWSEMMEIRDHALEYLQNKLP